MTAQLRPGRALRRCAAVVGLVLAAASCGGGGGGGGGTTTVPTTAVGDGSFRQAACPAGAPIGATCGSVPIDLAGVPGASVFVVRVPTPAGSAAPPLVRLGDEAGSATTGDIAPWRAVARTLGRDVLLIDRRGTGGSVPAATCTGMDPPDYLARSYLNATTLTTYRDAITACATAMRTAGTPPGTFSVEASVGDVVRVRQALGITSWFLSGSHEGARLAVEVAKADPAAVAGLVLDAPTPLTGTSPGSRVQAASEAVTGLLAACPSAAPCKGAADVGARWEALVGALVDAPVTVQPVDARTGKQVPVRVYQRSAWPGVADGLRTTASAGEVLSSVLGPFTTGDWSALGRWRVAALPGPGWSAPARLDVVCPDNRGLAENAAWTTFLRDAARWDDLLFFSGEPTGCAAWGAPAPAPPGATPVAAPTLVLAGALDPIAGTAAPAAAAAAIPGAQLVVFPLGAGDAATGPCGWSIVAGFTADPTRPADAGCAAGPPAWTAP